MNRLDPVHVVGALLFAVQVAAHATSAEPTTQVDGPKWQPWLQLGGSGSTEQSGAAVLLFAPLWQSQNAIVFADIEAKLFEDDIREGTIALGARKLGRQGWNPGAWAGFDVRSSSQDNTFRQFSFGLEALHRNWDLRANGYLNLSDPKGSPGLARVRPTGNKIVMIGGEEVPLQGFDGEVGWRVPLERWRGASHGRGNRTSNSRRHELRLYGGGFRFDHDDALEAVAGPRARIEWRIDEAIARIPGSRLTVEGKYQYDDLRRDQWEAGVWLRLPFQAAKPGGVGDSRFASLNAQERRMTDAIVRDRDIVTAPSKGEAVTDAVTGVPLERVGFVDNADLQQVIDALGAESLIIAGNDAGPIPGGVTLQANQTLQGGGSTIAVIGRRSGTSAGFTAPGSRPVVQSAADSAVMIVASNTHVAGVDVVGAGQNSGLGNNHGLVGPAGVGNVAISDTVLMESGGSGILFDGNSFGDLLVANSAVANSGATGVHLRGVFDGALSFTNTAVATSAAGAHGYWFDGTFNGPTSMTGTSATTSGDGASGHWFDGTFNGPVTMTDANATTTGSAAYGYWFNQTLNGPVTLTGTSAITTGPGSFGYWFNGQINGPVTMTGTSATTTGSGAFGYWFNGLFDGAVTLTDTSATTTGSGGFGYWLIGQFNSPVSLTGATASAAGSGTFGAWLTASFNAPLSITNMAVTNAGADGLNLTGIFAGGASITDTTITNAGRDGLVLDAAGQPIRMSNTSFSGVFGDDVIDLEGAGNQLSGDGNVFSGAFGTDPGVGGFDAPGQFCETAGTQTGSFAFTSGATCP